jgi:hypothetical protein
MRSGAACRSWTAPFVEQLRSIGTRLIFGA